MNIAIIGSGGVGGYFGGRLAQAGYPVTFLARGAHLAALQAKGLTVKSVLGDFQISSVHVTDRILDIPSPDLVILAIKAWQVNEIAADLARILHPGSVILPLQNGIMTASELAAYMDQKHILGGVCRIFSKMEAPGVIDHFYIEPAITFGELDNAHTSRSESIQTLFTKAGISSFIAIDIQSELWKKLITICVGGLLAISRLTYGELREIPETRQLMIDLLNENLALAKRAGMHIAPDFVAKSVAFIDSFPHASTSSLTRDVWAGKPSELEYQNGTMVKLGQQYGLAMPINRVIYNCILPHERRARQAHT